MRALCLMRLNKGPNDLFSSFLSYTLIPVFPCLDGE